MEDSSHNKVACRLPRLRGRIPWQDWGDEVSTIVAAGDIYDIVNHCRSQSSSYSWRKLAAHHLPPLCNTATSVSGHLVIVSVSCERKNLHLETHLSAGESATTNKVIVAPRNEENLFGDSQ